MATPGVSLAFGLACLLATAGSAVAQSAAAAYLSTEEREVLRELNLARTDPKRYAGFLTELKPYFKGNQLHRPGRPVLVTQEGVAAFDEAISFLHSVEPLPALRPSRGLSLAARTHVEDQKNGAMGHTGSDGSEPWDRMNRYGSWQHEVAENIAYGGYSTREVVIQLLVDDGVPDRQHRLNMFNPKYRFVGVACGAHARFHAMCVMDYAAGYVERETGSENAQHDHTPH